MPRGDSLTRQLKLMQILEARREFGVSAIARELGITERTVYRDLIVLERVGVPIYQEKEGRRARWRVVEGYQRKLALTLSAGEAFALAVGQKLLGGLPASMLAENARTAWKKVADAMPMSLRGKFDNIDGRVSGTLGAQLIRLVPRDVQRVVEGAVERGETIRFRYRGANARRASERLVDGYLLHLQGGTLYLIGYCHLRRSLRLFRLDRIHAPATTRALFQVQQRFASSEILQGAFGPWHGRVVCVELKFASSVAPLIAERKLHPTQLTQLRNDGGLDVSMRLPICPELVRWIIGWGACVQIVEPWSLAEEVRCACALAAMPDRFQHAPVQRQRALKCARRGL